MNNTAMNYQLKEFLDLRGGTVPNGMIPVLCFVVRGHLKSATLYSRWAENEQRELLQVVTKWKNYDGGFSIPVFSVDEAAYYVRTNDKG